MKEQQIEYLSHMAKIYSKLGMRLVPLGSWDKWRTLQNGKEIPLGKSPCVEDWRNTKFSSAYIQNHIAKGKNVGFLLGDKDLVVDVDPRNGGDEGLAKLEEDLGYALADITTQVVTGSGGYHYYFKKPDTLKTVEVTDKYGDGVEFKTVGRQVVIPGSIHPGESNDELSNGFGQAYVWDDLSPSFDEIADCPQELLDLIERQTVSSNSNSGLMTCAQIEEILSQIPVIEFADNSSWFELMTSVHFATNGEAIEEFIDWSTSDANYADDGELIRYRWNSLDTDKADSTTHRTLLFYAEKYGVNTKQYDAQLDFDDIVEDGDDGTILLDSEAAELQLQSLLNSVDPIELANNLTSDYSSEDLEEALLACLRVDTITRMRCLKIIQRITGLTKADLKTVMKDVEDKQIRDLGEILAGYVLEKRFNKGKYLLFNIDGEFWQYNGTHWETVREEWLSGQVVAIWQKIRDKIGVSATTTTLVNQSMQLLRMTRAVKDDVFGFQKPPKSVINCSNCEIWIKSNGSYEVRKHSYKSYLTYCLETEYDELADCPLWDKAVVDIFSNSCDAKEMKRHFEEFVGYLIQPNKNIASWWMLKGFGSNGKSMLMDVVSNLMGPDSVLSSSVHDLNTGRNNHALAALPGKLMIYDDDLDAHTILPDGLLKKVSERKLLEANPKGKKTFNFVSCATPVLLTNLFPKSRDVSNGTRRRVHVIPFDRQFETFEIDRTLASKIMKNDMPGILNAALQGLKRLRVRGYFDEPEDCQIAKQTWLDESNTVPAFLRDCTDETRVSGSYVTLKELFESYEMWHREQGISSKPIGKRNFTENLNAMGYQVVESTGHQRRVMNLKLLQFRTDDFDDDDLD